MTHVRLNFLKRMLAIYVTIVVASTLVAILRFAFFEQRRILHQLIVTISNHLVLARISASLLSWGKPSLQSSILHNTQSAGNCKEAGSIVVSNLIASSSGAQPSPTYSLTLLYCQSKLCILSREEEVERCKFKG